MPELCNFHSIPNTIGGGSREITVNTKYRNDYRLWSDWYTNYGQYDCPNNKFTSFWKWMFKNYGKDTEVEEGILNILDTCTFDDEIEINLYENNLNNGREFENCNIKKVIITKKYNENRGYNINKRMYGVKCKNVTIDEVIINMILSKTISTIGNNFIYLSLIFGDSYFANITCNINLITLSTGSKGSLIQSSSVKLPKNININIDDIYNFDIDDTTHKDNDIYIDLYRIAESNDDNCKITYYDDESECNIYFTFNHIFSDIIEFGLTNTSVYFNLLDIENYETELSNGVIRFYLNFQVNSNIRVYLPTDTSDYNYEVYLDFKNGATCTFTNTSSASPGSVHILNCPASIASYYTKPCFVIENTIGLTVDNIIANKYLMSKDSII